MLLIHGLQRSDIVRLVSTAPARRLAPFDGGSSRKRNDRRELAERLGISVRELRVREESADLPIGTALPVGLGARCAGYGARRRTGRLFASNPLGQSQATRLMKVAAKLRDRSRRAAIQTAGSDFRRAVGRDSARPAANWPKEPSPGRARSRPAGIRSAPCPSESSCNVPTRVE